MAETNAIAVAGGGGAVKGAEIMAEKISPSVTLYFATIRAAFPEHKVRTDVSDGMATATVIRPDKKKVAWTTDMQLIEKMSALATADAIARLKRLLDPDEHNPERREPWG